MSSYARAENITQTNAEITVTPKNLNSSANLESIAIQRWVVRAALLLGFPAHENPWESELLVKGYYKNSHLMKPEETVLNKLRAKLAKMRMLDLGVGAGRTTYHFAPLAREYVGVDYSKNMIRACRQKFRNYPKKISFKVADARDLNSFRDNYFDFSLFSFNGLDCMNHNDRLKTLREIRRVTKNGGYFCFSTHNLNHAMRTCAFNLSRKDPRTLLFEIRRLFLTRLHNRKIWKVLRRNQRKQQHAIIHDFRDGPDLRVYYITPREQIDQLTSLNFKCIRSYDLLGKEIKNPSEFWNATDHWCTGTIQYLCNV